jgi:demethylmenaquinone methyltransferase/2-methoxy-6-polyprenyl-1,4-benzoquinol methylase
MKPLTQVVTPYEEKDRSKKEQVAEMFDNIAPSYDFLNHFLSMGVDYRWRRKAIKLLAARKPRRIMDIATGTGDFAIEALRLNPDEVIGLDISPGMLEVGRRKVAKLGKSSVISMVEGDSEALPYADNTIDAVTVGFGVRNFENLPKGMAEIARVLRPGGQAVVLEPAIPEHFPMRQLFFLYFKGILPLVGRIVSRDRRAYTYLPQSVQAFPKGEAFLEICRKAGFSHTQYKPLTLGICSLYLLEK